MQFGSYALAMAVATAVGALSSGVSYGTYNYFKEDNFNEGFSAGAKTGAVLFGVFGTLALVSTMLLGERVGNIFSSFSRTLNGLGSPMYMNGVGSLQNSLGSPMYVNGLGALVASPVGALVASPVGSCVGCGDWF